MWFIPWVVSIIVTCRRTVYRVLQTVRVPGSFVSVIDLGLIPTCSAVRHLHAPYAGVTNFSERRRGIACTPRPVLCESKSQRVFGCISL